MCDMLHDAKFCDVLHDARCVTYNMQQNVWCVTRRKMSDVLHDTKCVMCYMTENARYVTWHKMCDVLHECVTFFIAQDVGHFTKFEMC